MMQTTESTFRCKGGSALHAKAITRRYQALPRRDIMAITRRDQARARLCQCVPRPSSPALPPLAPSQGPTM